MTSDVAALALVDRLRTRGAVEVSVPVAVVLDDGTSVLGVLSARFTGAAPTSPAPVEPASEEPDVAHREAPDCECKACRIAFGSAD